MNYKENLVERLKLFDIDFKEADTKVLVLIEPFEIEVIFHDDFIRIDPIIKGWNHVTDFMQMKFKNSLKYLFSKLLLYTIGLFLVFYDTMSLNYFTILISLFFLFSLLKFTCYLSYYIKLESIKKNIIDWTIR